MNEKGPEELHSQKQTLEERLFNSMGRILVSRTISKALSDGRSDLYPILQNITIIPDGELAEYDGEKSKIELKRFKAEFNISDEEVESLKKELGLTTEK